MGRQTLNLRRARSHKKAAGQPDRRSLEEAATHGVLAAIIALAEGVRRDVPSDGAARDVLLLALAYRELAAY